MISKNIEQDSDRMRAFGEDSELINPSSEDEQVEDIVDDQLEGNHARDKAERIKRNSIMLGNIGRK